MLCPFGKIFLRFIPIYRYEPRLKGDFGPSGWDWAGVWLGLGVESGVPRFLGGANRI
jgi:hypothetical protein